MRCESGHHNPEGTNFCGECGDRLTTATSLVQREPSDHESRQIADQRGASSASSSEGRRSSPEVEQTLRSKNRTWIWNSGILVAVLAAVLVGSIVISNSPSEGSTAPTYTLPVAVLLVIALALFVWCIARSRRPLPEQVAARERRPAEQAERKQRLAEQVRNQQRVTARTTSAEPKSGLTTGQKWSLAILVVVILGVIGAATNGSGDNGGGGGGSGGGTATYGSPAYCEQKAQRLYEDNPGVYSSRQDAYDSCIASKDVANQLRQQHGLQPLP